ncbi:MAG: AAA family ATPase [Chloroflexaceae bacterium]|jgi:DNA-binding SARP family transcriptional activator/tetratricopeptide (TPR) repeat protein|nr:AAA family ATPase [Chloroflexaceae bacterium]
MSTLTLRLLGSPELHTPQGRITMRRRQPVALLSYLALADGPVARSRLALVLFGDCSDSVARQRLTRPLHELRRALRDHGLNQEIVASHGDALCLGREHCDVDVTRFVAGCGCTSDAAAAALTLYRGPLLDGFDLNAAPEFDNWLAYERDRLARLHLDLLARLADHAAARGDWATVASHARQVLATDPLREDAHVRLMEAYAAEGQRAILLRHYDALCETLRRELDAEPLPETQERYHALVQQRRAAAPAPPAALAPLATPPFVGRSREQAALHHAYTQAQARLLQVVGIGGAAGVGKTRLLEESLATLQRETPDQPPTVLHVTCYANPPAAPYQALAEALRRSDHAATPSPDDPFARPPEVAPHAPATNSEQQFWELLAVALCKRLAPNPYSPAILAFDDLQWADAATLRALPYLMRRLSDLPMLLLLAYRCEASTTAFEDFLRTLAQRHPPPLQLELPPLDAGEVQTIVAAYTGDQPHHQTLSEQLFRETEGNPFFLIEMLRDLDERGQLAHAPVQQAGTSFPLPQRVRAAIEERLLRLPVHAQQVADAAAVIGREADPALLRQMTSLSESAFVHALAQLERAGLLTSTGSGYRFSHGKVQEALYDRLGLRRRQLLHRRAAQVLAQRKSFAEASLLLAHAQRAHEWQLAFEAARTAAAEARRLVAFADAATFASAALAALDALGAAPTERIPVLLERENDHYRLGRRAQQAEDLDAIDQYAAMSDYLGAALYRRGRYLHALGKYQEAEILLEQALLETSDQAATCEIQLMAALNLMRQSKVVEAVHYAQQALGTAHMPGGARLRLHAYLLLAQLAQRQDDHGQARKWFDVAQPLAHIAADTQAELWLLLARSELRKGDHSTMLTYAERARALYAAQGNLAQQASCLVAKGVAEGNLNQFGHASESLREAYTLSGMIEDPHGQALAQLNLGVVLHRVGIFAEAFQAFQFAWRHFEFVDSKLTQSIAAMNLASVLATKGHGAEAEQWARTGLALAEALNLTIRVAMAAYMLAHTLLQQGKYAAAAELYQRTHALDYNDTALYGTALAHHAMACQGLGQPAAADQHSAAAVAIARTQSGIEHPQAMHAVRALVLHQQGDATAAGAALSEARQTLDHILASIAAPADRQSYLSNIPANRFIAAAEQGDWETEHPLFCR